MRKCAVAATILFCLAAPALADSIDGDWCNAKNEQLTINGKQITLPTGQSIFGQYGRHEFAYKVPFGETNAGQVIYMQLFDEYDMTSYVIKDNKPDQPVNWTRCQVSPKTS